MAKVKFEDGTVLNFDSTPTQQDIDEAYSAAKGSRARNVKLTSIPFDSKELKSIFPPLMT